MTIKVSSRRPRSDSAKAATQAAQNAAMGPLEPPPYVLLRPQDKPHWNAIMQARPRHTWHEADLVTAATVARAQADIIELQRLVDEQGYIVEGKINPAATALDTLSKRVVTLSRLLHTHAEATLGRAADSAKQSMMQREAASQDDDDLIPTLRMVK
ncbi:MAG: TerS protein [Pusillimonas sp.]